MGEFKMAEGRSEKKKKKKKVKTIRKKEERIHPFLTKCNKRFDLIKPAFTRDSSLVLCGCGSDIYLFHRKTGEVDKIFTKHTGDVLRISINQHNPLQVISCCNNQVILWDYSDLMVVKTFDISLNATDIYVNPSSTLDYILCKNELPKIEKKKKHDSGLERTYHELVKYDLKDETVTTIGNVNREPNTVAFTSDGKYAVYVNKHSLFVYDPVEDTKRLVEYAKSGKLTSVVVHPQNTCVATGGENGRIILWYNVLVKATTKKIKNATQVILHWHHHQPQDITFSSDGLYLLSGGLETVVVVWHVENQTRNFLPNMGSQINKLFCSKDGRFFGTVMDNNMIKVINGVDHSLHSSIKFLSPADDVSSGLSYHTKLKSLVLNGQPEGILQFYQPNQDKVQLTLDILGENVILQNKEKTSQRTIINKVAVNQFGNWMATEEVRTTKVLPVERKLSFWVFSDEEKSFILNTLVNPPHDASMTSMVFRPRHYCQAKSKKNMLVTSSESGELKSWVLEVTENEKGEFVSKQWILDNVYATHQEHCKMTSFSHDGSTLAVLYDEITLFEPESLTEQTNLNWPSKSEDPLKSFCFCHHSTAHFLAGCSNNYIMVWNLKNGGIVWQLEANVLAITADPYSFYFAAVIQAEEKSRFLLFRPQKPTPLVVIPDIGIADSPIKDMIFIPPVEAPGKMCGEWPSTGQLYILTKNANVYTITDVDDRINDIKTERKVEEESMFESMYISKDNELTMEDKYSHLALGNPSKIALSKMMTTPSHILPSVDVMCKAFYHSLLLENSKVISKQEEEEEKLRKEKEGGREADDENDETDSDYSQDEREEKDMSSDEDEMIDIDKPSKKQHKHVNKDYDWERSAEADRQRIEGLKVKIPKVTSLRAKLLEE